MHNLGRELWLVADKVEMWTGLHNKGVIVLERVAPYIVC